jgi:zinc transporter, ZIP family
MVDLDPMIFILLLSVAGPIIGSAIGVLKRPSEKFMNNMLSFAAGIMLAISFMQLLPESIEMSSTQTAIIGLIIGFLVMYFLDKFLPHIHPELCQQEQGKNLKKTATFLIIGIFLHNFPEGMAIATGFYSDIKVSISIALAIAIHNIPEGICTSCPYYMCTKERLKSFLISSSTAIPVLVGFTFAYILYQYISLELIGLLTAVTAGIMIYISGDELIPVSSRKMTNHHTIFSFMAGILLVLVVNLI